MTIVLACNTVNNNLTEVIPNHVTHNFVSEIKNVCVNKKYIFIFCFVMFSVLTNGTGKNW